MTVAVLRVNEKNLNGRIYSIDTVQQMIAMFNRRTNLTSPMIGNLGFPVNGESTLSNISHAVKNLNVKGDVLEAEIEILETPCGKILSELLKHNEIVFRPTSSGYVYDSGDVSVCDFLSIDAILKTDDSYENL